MIWFILILTSIAVYFLVSRLMPNSIFRKPSIFIIVALIMALGMFLTKSEGKIEGVILKSNCVKFNKTSIGPKVSILIDNNKEYSFTFTSKNKFCKDRIDELTEGGYMVVDYYSNFANPFSIRKITIDDKVILDE